LHRLLAGSFAMLKGPSPCVVQVKSTDAKRGALGGKQLGGDPFADVNMTPDAFCVFTMPHLRVLSKMEMGAMT